MSIRSDLEHDGDACPSCDRPLCEAEYAERHDCPAAGEWAGHRVRMIVCTCQCGTVTPVVWETEPPPVGLTHISSILPAVLRDIGIAC